MAGRPVAGRLCGPELALHGSSGKLRWADTCLRSSTLTRDSLKLVDAGAVGRRSRLLRH